MSLQPGIYCKSRSGDLEEIDNSLMDVDVASVFDVLMFNDAEMRWYYLDEETWGWEPCAENYDPTEGGASMIKITGPDLPGVMSTKRVRVR